MDFDRSILREADIRGIYPTQVSGDFAYRLGCVFGTYILSKGHDYCVVGHDNRFGGPHLTKRLIEGLLSTGTKVFYVGLVTTPMFNFASYKAGLEYGIMVTASHNPKEDNGFKLFGENYQHCSHAVLNKIYKMLSDKDAKLANGHGKIDYVDVADSYAEDLASRITLGKKPLKVVVDCGNGTASVTIRKVYERFPFDTTFIYADSNPNFPNHHPDPNVKANLKKLSMMVKKLHADLGIAYDGDADRGGFVDNKGNIVESDKIMAIMCKDIIAQSENKKVLIDVKCSKALEDEIIKNGGEVVVATPSSAEQERIMAEQNITFGGGYSNHVFFRDRHFGYDDGIYFGLRVQEMLSNTRSSLYSLTKKLKSYYNTEEIKVATTDAKKFKIVEGVKKYCDTHHYKYETIDGVKVILDDGWALIRASNTGPNLTLRFEATTEHRLKRIQKEFMDVLGILQK